MPEPATTSWTATFRVRDPQTSRPESGRLVALQGARHAHEYPSGRYRVNRNRDGRAASSADPGAPAAPDAVRTLVSRLDLERYKATIKGLTQFGDRRQGTERNRKAVDWIEAQLKSYGCATERIKYDLRPAAAGAAPAKPAPRPRAESERPRGRRRTSARARAPAPASTPTRCASPTSGCARSTASRPRPGRAKRSTAPRSARRGPTRCTSSARTWTATAGARPPTTTARARRW